LPVLLARRRRFSVVGVALATKSKENPNQQNWLGFFVSGPSFAHAVPLRILDTHLSAVYIVSALVPSKGVGMFTSNINRIEFYIGLC
jgi:hypothetical protein